MKVMRAVAILAASLLLCSAVRAQDDKDYDQNGLRGDDSSYERNHYNLPSGIEQQWRSNDPYGRDPSWFMDMMSRHGSPNE